jgi:predicted nucleotidyltransferase component of viral defense system
MAASVRGRLLKKSQETGDTFNRLLILYAIERLLFRLSQSPDRANFVLKGAMLFALWTGRMHRPTRDLDLLGFGDSGPERLAALFRSLCTLPVEDDGLLFQADSVTVEEIREDQEYGGQRVILKGVLGTAEITLQVDVGFGDAITPAAVEVDYPTLLAMPAPHLRAYPRETVVSEKLEAMTNLGMANSRMKDFYDVWVLSREFEFQGESLRRAVSATFGRRATELPTGAPVALTAAFSTDAAKKTQWSAFLKRSELQDKAGELDAVVAALAVFLLPALTAATAGKEWPAAWPKGGPWNEP